MKKLIILFVIFTSYLANGQYVAYLDIVITHNDDPTDVQTLNDVEFKLNEFPSNTHVFDTLLYHNHTVTVVDNGLPEVLDTVYLQNGVLYISMIVGTFPSHLYYKTKITNELFSPSLNVNDLTYNEFKIYPNPTTDYINLSTEVPSVLYDLYGNKVLEETSKQIDVRHLPKGMYIINVNNSKQLITKQ